MKKIITIIMTIVLLFPCFGNMPVQARTKTDWQKLYQNYVSKNYTDIDSYEAALIYIDKDDVPELYIKSSESFMANDVCTIVTIKKNKVKTFDLSNQKMLYAPKKNRMYCHCGAGTFIIEYLKISQIKNGKEKVLWNAIIDQDPTYNNKVVYDYYINNKKVSTKKYKAYVKKTTKKYKWKDVEKELKPLEQIIDTELKAS